MQQLLIPLSIKHLKKLQKLLPNIPFLLGTKNMFAGYLEGYLLVGKSYFYEREYKLAIQTFEYIIKTYPEYSTKYSAMLWLARTNDQLKQYEKAESTLDFIGDKMDKSQLPKVADKEFPLVYADYHIKQEDYSSAIEYLRSGIDKNKKKPSAPGCVLFLRRYIRKMAIRMPQPNCTRK